jgi:Phospholipase_D-nuclease N-terminal
MAAADTPPLLPTRTFAWEAGDAALIGRGAGGSREGMTINAITTDFGEVLLWSFWFFIWIAALMVWFRCLFDLFSDSSLSGWAKAGWAVLLIFVPWLGALIYLIARGRSMTWSMTERQMAAVAQRQAEQEKYIQKVASTSQGPAEQIASAKALLDSGAVTQAEYESLKAKALA